MRGSEIRWLGAFYGGWLGFSIAIAVVVVATALGLGAVNWLGLFDVLMMYVFAVAVLSAHVHRAVAVFAAVLAVVAFQVFFGDRVSRFGSADVFTVVVLILVALAISDSAAALRAHVRSLAERQHEIEMLALLDTALARAGTPREVARIAADRCVEILHFDGAAAALLEQSGQVLRLLYAKDYPRDVEAMLERGIPVGAAVAGRAVARREPVVSTIDDYPQLAGSELAAAVRAARMQTIVATPFLAHGTVYGALTLVTRRRVDLTPAMMALLASVGTQIGLGIAHAAERERILAQERMAALGRLAASVGHELRNPLTVIAGRVELLATSPAAAAGTDLRRQIERLQEAVERMKAILRGLSNYAKPAGADVKPVDVPELLHAVRDLVNAEARSVGVAIRVIAAEGLPTVRWNRSQFTQVLVNLATNAIEAMAEHGGELELRAATDNGAVIIDVADTGPGIPPEILENVWEPFYTTKAEGTGLGLSIVRGLLAEHGAQIEVSSEVGRGTTFRMSFPAPGARERAA